jgi:predicted TIM-barrel fold metal-dependent hydrolase
MVQHPTTFERTADLARLPWFDLVEGRLKLDPAIGPIVDFHSHLALTYLRRANVDLLARTSSSLTYLPATDPMDLDVYANRNLDPAAMAAMKTDLTGGSFQRHPGHISRQAHPDEPTAVSMRASHTVPNLLRDMADMSIQTSVLHAIDLPLGLSHNALEWLAATTLQSRSGSAAEGQELVVFGSVHPLTRDPGPALDAQQTAGARGIKLHPAVQLVNPGSDRCLRLYRACGARGLPIFFHCGPVDIETRLGRRLSQVANYERAVAECPETSFVLGHAGALQAREAVRLADRYPNVWLELASQPLGTVRHLLEEGPRQRIVFGSDWPFYPQAMGIAKVLISTEGDPTIRTQLLADNSQRLLTSARVMPDSEGGDP